MTLLLIAIVLLITVCLAKSLVHQLGMESPRASVIGSLLPRIGLSAGLFILLLLGALLGWWRPQTNRLGNPASLSDQGT